MTSLGTKIRTYWSLRPANLIRVAWYRLKLKLGLFPKSPSHLLSASPLFFRPSNLPPVDARLPQLWQDRGLLFDFLEFAVSNTPPDWLADPVTGKSLPNSDRIWWRIPDFDNNFGDIKRIWELSRLGWALAMAQRARNGCKDSQKRLNSWLADWCLHNPPFRGPNWKCGQEASIRVMHLAMVAVILGQEKKSEKALLVLVKQHLERIAPTIGYAAAQENNHATSEAAALFIGGSWLVAHGDVSAHRYYSMGRRKLEDFVQRLVSTDGSFSQHSVNYHRVFLDTMSMCEIWRRGLSLEAFSKDTNILVAAATDWLRHFIFSSDGDCPNLGANDGARLLALADSCYRDFRPSVQLASILFLNKRAYDNIACDQSAKWTGIEIPSGIIPVARSKIFPAGGYAVLRKDKAAAMLRFPRRTFRPGHCDALHVDLWVGGRALLRDGGTFSYNDGNEWLDYFSGDAGHNGIQFGDAPQMPRIGRFLFGDWLETNITDQLLDNADHICFGAGYVNRKKYGRHRTVTLHSEKLVVVDTIAGFAGDILARWRLCPGTWVLNENYLTCDAMTVEVKSDDVLPILSLGVGHESLHYTQKTELPVLSVTTPGPTVLTTTFRWGI